jgi:hypothetical protein
MPENSNWVADSVRATAFFAPSVTVRSEGWWSLVTGSEPENRNSRPTRGEFVDTGAFLGNTLTMSVQPGRIDWFLLPGQQQFENVEIAIKSIGQFPGIVDSFVRGMELWLADCPAVVRLAYGAVLFEQIDNQIAGYRRLSEYLTAVRIDESSKDFFYQVNRPRQLEDRSRGVINRLSKWSLASFQPVRMAFSGATLAIGPSAVFAPPDAIVYACRLELDLSTDATRLVEIPHDKLPQILRELANIGSEIANQGDIP